MKLVRVITSLATILILSACAGTGRTHSPRRGADGLVLDFEGMQPGSIVPGWRNEATKPSPTSGTWSVAADGSGSVLDLTGVDHVERRTFNLYWTGSPQFLDGDLSVRVRANSGVVDQGGGLIWRVLDADNYYITRYNPLEENLRLYYVKEGKREVLADVPGVVIPAGTWFKLDVRHVGSEISVSLDSKELIRMEDTTFPLAGGIGLWTKADAATSFDDFMVRPDPAK